MGHIEALDVLIAKYMVALELEQAEGWDLWDSVKIQGLITAIEQLAELGAVCDLSVMQWLTSPYNQ